MSSGSSWYLFTIFFLKKIFKFSKIFVAKVGIVSIWIDENVAYCKRKLYYKWKISSGRHCSCSFGFFFFFNLLNFLKKNFFFDTGVCWWKRTWLSWMYFISRTSMFFYIYIIVFIDCFIVYLNIFFFLVCVCCRQCQNRKIGCRI